jgi:hypothetical protein
MAGWSSTRLYGVVLVVAVVVGFVCATWASRTSSRETFLGGLFDKVKAGAGTVKNAAVKGGQAVAKGGKVAASPWIGTSNSTMPAYVGRQWDGRDWVCPWWTVDTGLEDARACITSQFHNPLWRWDGKAWAWSCPNGTVPTDEEQWEKKCEGGGMGRQLLEGKWQCPWGTEDSRRTWDNSSWREAQKQCRRIRPYTVRVRAADGKWVCPEGSTDTGVNWGSKNEWDQCKWNGG